MCFGPGQRNFIFPLPKTRSNVHLCKMSSSDSELKEDEEEILVYVEFDNCATNDVFSSEHLKLDMLGLDSEHPVMQVNGKVCKSHFDNY